VTSRKKRERKNKGKLLKRMKKMKMLITRIMKGETVYKMNIDKHWDQEETFKCTQQNLSPIAVSEWVTQFCVYVQLYHFALALFSLLS
jgi:uncharacterized membrane protein YcaP (DUF421 family)